MKERRDVEKNKKIVIYRKKIIEKKEILIYSFHFRRKDDYAYCIIYV